MAFKVSRAAVEAAAKAAGLDLRKVTPSQYRTLCAAAAAEVTPTAAGISAKGTVGAGAGLAAAGVGLGTKGAAGTDLGANAIPMCECFGSPAVSLYGAKATGAAGIRGGVRVGAPAAGGHGRDLASNAISGLRAGMCTATADGCGQCSKLEAEAHSLNYSLQRHSSQLWRMNIALVNEVDRLQKKMSGMKSDNIRNTMGIMATGIGAFLAVGAFFATDVQEAWMGETLAEMDRRAAARISGGDGGAPGARAKQVGAAAAPPGNGNAPAKATATATVNK